MDPLSTSLVDRRADLLSSATLFRQFLDERRYLKNCALRPILNAHSGRT